MTSQVNPKIKLGKLPAKLDKRTIPLRKVLKPILPALPEAFNVQAALGKNGLKFPEGEDFGNETEGCCVEVAKFLHQISFEAFEQRRILPVTEEDVVKAYKAEAGNGYGLIMLDSLKQWRNEGLLVGPEKKFLCLKWEGKRYKCHAFAAVDMIHIDEIKTSIALLFGLCTGLMLPATAAEQYNKGETWDVVEGPGSEPGSWGGHGVYTYAYEPFEDQWIYQCYTWGRRQNMTHNFMLRYCDERYAVIDAANREGSPVDEDALNRILEEVSK